MERKDAQRKAARAAEVSGTVISDTMSALGLPYEVSVVLRALPVVVVDGKFRFQIYAEYDGEVEFIATSPTTLVFCVKDKQVKLSLTLLLLHLTSFRDPRGTWDLVRNTRKLSTISRFIITRHDLLSARFHRCT